MNRLQLQFEDLTYGAADMPPNFTIPDPGGKYFLDMSVGGLLRRGEGSDCEIAVIHGRRRGDWLIPKGHLKPDEAWEDAAIREVTEETGCIGTVEGIAGTIAYIANGMPKVVIFFAMKFLSLSGAVIDPEEVSEVRWMTPDAAVEIVSYPEERDLLVRFFKLP